VDVGGVALFVESMRRITYLALALFTIGIGLLVHFHGTQLSAAARDLVGDALWAAMIMWWTGALGPRARIAWRGGAAYVICVLVELSQLYETPALDALRATTPGHLVLGSGFDPRDFAAYALGVVAAVSIETIMRRSR